MKKFQPNNPERPRNAKKRAQRNAKESHRRIMQQKKELEQQQPQQEEKKKIFHKENVADVKKYIKRLKQKITLPFEIEALRKGGISKVVIINREGKERELLPNIPGTYKILCHSRVAKVITSDMCVIAKITQHERITDDGRQWLDGSWSIAPCSPAMLNGTTIQHVRRRPLWFLRRYWYEISFDGRVQPASLFYDYDINPLTKKQTMFVTHEFIKVKNKDAENDYFRFWRYKKNIK